jgi:hypothetical protein
MSRTIPRWSLALIATVVSAADRVDVNVTPAMRAYCHIMRFPRGWNVPAPPNYAYNSEYEFRVPGLLETRFLIGGLVFPYNQYTVNKYTVDLSDPKAPVFPTSDAAWNAATPVSIVRNAAPPPAVLQAQKGRLLGFERLKSGEIFAGDLLSPDGAWFVVMSWSGRADYSESPVSFACFPFGCRGKLFFDIFNADIGKKVLTMVGSYLSPSPTSLLPTGPGWVTERYFILPLGEHREQCLVCEFGRGKGSKP